MHWPVDLKKGSVISKLTEEDKLGYDPERVAKAWTVREADTSTSIYNILTLLAFWAYMGVYSRKTWRGFKFGNFVENCQIVILQYVLCDQYQSSPNLKLAILYVL